MSTPDGEFVIVVLCKDCKRELNRSHPLTRKEYTQAVMSAPLNTKPCPNGCRSSKLAALLPALREFVGMACTEEVNAAVSAFQQQAVQILYAEADSAQRLIDSGTGTELGNHIALTIVNTNKEQAKRIRALPTDSSALDLLIAGAYEAAANYLRTRADYWNVQQEHTSSKELRERQNVAATTCLEAAVSIRYFAPASAQAALAARDAAMKQAGCDECNAQHAATHEAVEKSFADEKAQACAERDAKLEAVRALIAKLQHDDHIYFPESCMRCKLTAALDGPTPAKG